MSNKKDVLHPTYKLMIADAILSAKNYEENTLN